jgi:hypothetical protein
MQTMSSDESSKASQFLGKTGVRLDKKSGQIEPAHAMRIRENELAIPSVLPCLQPQKNGKRKRERHNEFNGLTSPQFEDRC